MEMCVCGLLIHFMKLEKRMKLFLSMLLFLHHKDNVNIEEEYEFGENDFPFRFR